MKNRLIRMDKPCIKMINGKWSCGILVRVLGFDTPKEAYDYWARPKEATIGQ